MTVGRLVGMSNRNQGSQLIPTPVSDHPAADVIEDEQLRPAKHIRGFLLLSEAIAQALQESRLVKKSAVV